MKKLPAEVLVALAEADRTPGWNNRSPEIRQFEIGNFQPCTLYVVPFRCWANRRQERLAEEWWREQGQGHAGVQQRERG